MNYTLHQLKIFLTIVEKKSVTKAAEELFLTQPAVSIQLRNFQDQFPLPLTEVIGRRLYITEFGKEIAQASSVILEEVAAIDYKSKQYQGILAGKLSIAVVSTGKYVMPYYLADFVNDHPGIDFNMDVTNRGQVVHDLENNKVDFALVSVLPDHLKLETLPLLKNSLHLVGGTERIEASNLKPDEIFKNEPLLYREPGSATRMAMEKFIEGKNIPVAKKIELTSNEALKQAVIAGLGYSIMPLIGIKKEVVDEQISIIKCKGLPVNTQWNLVWLKQKKMSPLAIAFITHLENEKSKIQKKFFHWV